jgi:hypothetical protein
MPLAKGKRPPINFPNPEFLTLDSWKKGVISLIDKSRLPKDALESADNAFLYEDGQPGPRPGVGWYGSSLPSVRQTTKTITTNLITNPSIETNATSWTALQGAETITRDNTHAQSGTWALKCITTNAAPEGVVYNIGSLTAGTTITVSVYVWASAAQAYTVQMDAFTSGAAYISTPVSTGGTGSGAWQRVTITGLLPATCTNVNFIVKVASVVATFWIDAVQAEVASAVDTYFDGATTDTASTDYDWTGTANASTSTRTVYDMAPAVIDGFDYFEKADGTISLVVAGGGKVSRSLDDGVTWTECTGATPTSGLPMLMNQSGAYLYLTNGTDNIIRYDGSTTLVTYTTLATPAAPTIVETGLAGTGYTYYYRCSLVNLIGFSIASVASAAVQSALPREAWNNTTDYATITVPAFIATQTRCDIYMSSDGGTNYYYLDSTLVSGDTYRDNGSALIIPSTTAPIGNTTQGPLVKELVNVGSRMYGVRDTANPSRIWFSSGIIQGAFSNAYDGGYLGWQTGGKYRPMKVEDYRDGKGTPLATVWCSSADGQGCILQMSLDTFTVGDISVTIPSAYQLPGSRGTPAPGSVVNVLNDYMFYNSQAFYNLGSRAQFLNLLSTDESSANIRPDVRNISAAAEANIASTYFEGRVYFSVPYLSTSNNYTAVYDTEKKAWLPKAFTIGFSKFLRYTDTGHGRRLLAIKPGDSRLTEISTNIKGDYGVAFAVEIATGLYPTAKDRFEFQFTEEGEVEFSNPQGDINVELVGIERTSGYSTIGTKTITGAGSSSLTTGWDARDWDTYAWDDTSDVSLADVSSESSLKRYFVVQKELNAVQWRISCQDINANWVLRTLQTWGTPTQAGKPRPWRLT